jgi:UDP-N-acetylmuramoyl-L-alanyl-D-glutamate--2,6-diaminopimelate ligase
MTLKELLEHLSPVEQAGTLSDASVVRIDYDSRKVVAGSVFVAIKGFKSDGHLFIDKAVAQGAIAVVCEEMPSEKSRNLFYVKVENSRKALAILSNAFFGNPTAKLKLIGITGTNGKTTTAFLAKTVLEAGGYKTGLIGTVRYEIGDEIIPAERTTPEAPELCEMFARMIDKGLTAAVMEVSSHSLVLDRVFGMTFSVGVFTNLTHDHLDFHGTMGSYFDAKKMLFDNLPESATAITNVDDDYGEIILKDTKAKTLRYGIEKAADVKATIFSYKLDGTVASISYDGQTMAYQFKLVGKFNAYNVLAAYSIGLAAGMARVDILRGLTKCESVAGRFEQVWSKDHRCAIIDYSHTPDALEKIIRAIKEIKPSDGNLITVFGCGGDRDKGKRPLMGRIASEDSDIIIVTSDNPRTEDPEQIMNDIFKGITRETVVYRILDREEAIRKGITLLARGDVLLVAGKGHEAYQEINGKRFYFNDKDMVLKIFAEQEDFA